MEKIKKVGVRLAGMVRSSMQLRMGLIFFALVLLVVIFAPSLAPFDPYDLGDDLLVPPGTNGHWLGTTNMGQDVLSMIIYGSRASLAIGIVSALTSGVIGTLLGPSAGFYGGKVDKVVSDLYAYFCENPMQMPQNYLYIVYGEGVERAVTDFISGMSDEYAISQYEKLFVPQKWAVL